MIFLVEQQTLPYKFELVYHRKAINSRQNLFLLTNHMKIRGNARVTVALGKPLWRLEIDYFFMALRLNRDRKIEKLR